MPFMSGAPKITKIASRFSNLAIKKIIIFLSFQYKRVFAALNVIQGIPGAHSQRLHPLSF